MGMGEARGRRGGGGGGGPSRIRGGGGGGYCNPLRIYQVRANIRTKNKFFGQKLLIFFFWQTAPDFLVSCFFLFLLLLLLLLLCLFCLSHKIAYLHRYAVLCYIRIIIMIIFSYSARQIYSHISYHPSPAERV